MILKQITVHTELYKQALILRNEILRIPLGQNIFNEDLSNEARQVHFAAIEKDQVVGCVVLVPHYSAGIGKLRQMATSEKIRGKGYGLQLVFALENYAIQNNMDSIILHARHYAVGFYQKLGYSVCSAVFDEVGMEHYKMSKTIQSKKGVDCKDIRAK